MSKELVHLSMLDAAEGIRNGNIDARELLDAYADWVAQSADETGAFTAIDFDLARDGIDQALATKQALAGIPLAIKDLIHVDGLPTSCASEILRGFVPPFEATVSSRLRRSGAVFYGKLNMDEFAMGSSNETSAFGPARNPWNTACTPGGSSGGSAAAVAARQVSATLGSDTGGSIRQPAAFCGITGLKPTYGRVSRYGLVAFASSLDQIGPMARDAKDCAALMDIIAGQDPLDGTSSDQPVPRHIEAPAQLQGMRIGLPEEYFADGLGGDVAAAVDGVKDWFKQHGAELVPVSLPHSRYIIATYYVLTSAEASSNLGRYDGIRYGFRANADNLLDVYKNTRGQGFGTEVKRRIMLGTFALSSGYYDAYYGKAQKARTCIRHDFDAAFADVDLILTPTTPTPAFELGAKIDDPLQMYLNDIYTCATNLAGNPAISFPCGFDPQGLPIGAQLIAPPFQESRLLTVTDRFQDDTDYHRQTPEMVKVSGAPS